MLISTFIFAKKLEKLMRDEPNSEPRSYRPVRFPLTACRSCKCVTMNAAQRAHQLNVGTVVDTAGVFGSFKIHRKN